MSTRLRLCLPVLFVILLLGAAAQSKGHTSAQQQPTVPPTNTPRFTATVPPTNTPRFTATPELPTATATTAATNTPTPTETPTTPPTLFPTPTLYYPDVVTQGEQPTAIPTEMPRLRSTDDNGNPYNLLNILLIGHDGEVVPDDPNFHTDTMIIVSINRDTNTVSMLSLPRDLFVYIPNWGMQRLNQAYWYGEAIQWTDGGWGML
ncbi:MAG TPA: LCP family protein, partial [Aggregatilineaceae bacterium]|nr:LCP family protein [Aggregatilineaceae bacterium]